MQSPPRLLIADDDADMRAWLRAIAEKLGVTVDEAEDGADLLAQLDAYDAVITDDRMPIPHGRHVVGMARACGVEIPFLIISAHDRDLHGEAANLGATDFLPKPFLPEAIRDWCTRSLRLTPGPLESSGKDSRS